jgi:glycosyltransferase involved in cell wall biosynthesis
MTVRKPKLFTVILHTYNRPHYLKISVDALLNQTYDNLEIILIDDGAKKETKECLYEFERKDKRVKLLHYKENQFRYDDPHRIIYVCFNDALKMSTGNYVWHQDDDDVLAEDYIEKMVNLFQGNLECISAAGLPVSIDANGKILISEIYDRKSNYRPRYMSGRHLCLECLKGKNNLFSSPGQIFSFDRDILIKYGGFHASYEYHQLYGIVPFGITGFDDSAYLYWRRHEGQLNKKLSSKGWIGTKEVLSMIDDIDLRKKWSVYGANTASWVVHKIKTHQAYTAAMWFGRSVLSMRFIAAIKIIRDIWFLPSFWLYLPKAWRFIPPWMRLWKK